MTINGQPAEVHPQDPSTYKLVTWHGEGRSLFYVMRQNSPEEWDCVETFTHREDALNLVNALNCS